MHPYKYKKIANKRKLENNHMADSFDYFSSTD